ncbi:hypothetical protein R1flu_020937 [Riccia fluitans]|uniref:Uncharacterized protein n=1 Tax=Riccia fluitans TaxID=41844 RepID=A0ABD1ZRC9_9MARC
MAKRSTLDQPSEQAMQVVSIPDPMAVKRPTVITGKHSTIEKGKDKEQWQDVPLSPKGPHMKKTRAR